MIGVVLGPIAGTNLRNALMSSGGRISTLVESPIPWTLYGLLVLILAYTAFQKIRSSRRRDV
jgi:putative tricarboxylic transport membrane protein